MELGQGHSVALEIFHTQAVFLPGDKIDHAGPFGGGLGGEMIDEALAIDREAHAIIGGGVEGVAAGGGGGDVAGPAD